MPLPISKVVAETPELAQGETDEKPTALPMASSTKVSASAAQRLRRPRPGDRGIGLTKYRCLNGGHDCVLKVSFPRLGVLPITWAVVEGPRRVRIGLLIKSYAAIDAE